MHSLIPACAGNDRYVCRAGRDSFCSFTKAAHPLIRPTIEPTIRPIIRPMQRATQIPLTGNALSSKCTPQLTTPFSRSRDGCRAHRLQWEAGVKNLRILLAKSDRVPAAVRLSCHSLRHRTGSGRLRATRQGSRGKATARQMPAFGQPGEFANSISTFSRRTS